MELSEKKEQFIKALKSKGFGCDVFETAYEVGLTDREFGEITSEHFLEMINQIKKDLVHIMMEENLGDPFTNEVLATYTGLRIAEEAATEILKNHPDVNFGNVKRSVRWLIKNMRKDFRRQFAEAKTS
jgi:hypothetical protein